MVGPRETPISILLVMLRMPCFIVETPEDEQVDPKRSKETSVWERGQYLCRCCGYSL